MRPKKQPTVTLSVPKYGIVKEFGVEHAERLLDMGPFLNGGWELADGRYTYDEENGLRLRADKRSIAETDKEG